MSYRADEMEKELKEQVSKLGVSLTFSHESEPLGTAGPLALAKNWLSASPEPFFVLNSDVICDFPFKELARYHKSHGKVSYYNSRFINFEFFFNWTALYWQLFCLALKTGYSIGTWYY